MTGGRGSIRAANPGLRFSGGRGSTRAANPGLHFREGEVPSEPQIQVCIFREGEVPSEPQIQVCISNTPRFHPSRVHFGNEKTRVAIFGRARFHPSRVRFLRGESKGSAWQEPRPPDGALPMAPSRWRPPDCAPSRCALQICVLLIPNKWKQRSLIGPIFGMGHEPRSDRIATNVFPFVFILPLASHARIPMAFLPAVQGFPMSFCEQRFPVPTPVFVVDGV